MKENPVINEVVKKFTGIQVRDMTAAEKAIFKVAVEQGLMVEMKGAAEPVVTTSISKIGQVFPDRHAYWTTSELEKQLTNKNGAFKFKGEGLYLTDTDTLLVAKSSLRYYGVYCWNMRVSQTLMGKTIPTMCDERS